MNSLYTSPKGGFSNPYLEFISYFAKQAGFLLLIWFFYISDETAYIECFVKVTAMVGKCRQIRLWEP